MINVEKKLFLEQKRYYGNTIAKGSNYFKY